MQNKQLTESALYESRFGFKAKRANALYVFVMALVFLFLLTVRVYVQNNLRIVLVNGSSMQQTLQDGQTLLMRRTNAWYKADYGDVIVVYVGGYKECEDVEGGHVIKRLIAKAGDSVRCTDGQIEICYAGTDVFVPLQEPYAYYGEGEAYKEEYDFAQYMLETGEIFFLGDNRSSEASSQDSRYKEGKSHLHCLYRETDVVGVVSAWAIENQNWLNKIFFWAK